MTSVLPASLLWGPVGRINHAIECQVAVFCKHFEGQLRDSYVEELTEYLEAWMSVPGQRRLFAPSFCDLKSLSELPPLPAMPWVDSLNGAQCHKRS
jgi:hypothetical protein